MMLDLVVLGNLLLDDIVYDDGRTRMGQAGGAVLYFALGAQLNGLEVGIVSLRGDEYPQSTLDDLAAHGIDVAGVHALGRPGLRTWLLYEGRVRRVVHRLEGPSHAEVSPRAEHIPPAWRQGARAFHLAPMPIAIQRDLVTALAPRDGAKVSLDPYEILRDADLPIWSHLLADVDVFLLSEDELLIEGEPRRALEQLAGGRLRQLAFKQGRRGGLLYDAGTRRFLPWRARASTVIDPTGAGDAFGAGLLAGLLKGEPAERGLERGVVTASFALEDHGAAGLLGATREKLEERLAIWYG